MEVIDGPAASRKFRDTVFDGTNQNGFSFCKVVALETHQPCNTAPGRPFGDVALSIGKADRPKVSPDGGSPELG